MLLKDLAPRTGPPAADGFLSLDNGRFKATGLTAAALAYVTELYAAANDPIAPDRLTEWLWESNSSRLHSFRFLPELLKFLSQPLWLCGRWVPSA